MLVTHSCYCWAVLTYIPPASYGAGDAQEVGKGEHQNSWPTLGTGLFCAMWRRAEQRNWGDLTRGLMLFRDCLGIGQWVASNCVVHHFFFFFNIVVFFFFFLPLFPFLLNCPYLNP